MADAIPDAIANLKAAVAISQNTPRYVIQGQALDCEPVVLEHIATNPSTPAAVLEHLVTHAQPEIRSALAENSNTPVHCIWLLVKDENPDVRYALAENHHLPDNVLAALAEDDNPYVADRAQRTITRLESERLQPETDDDWRYFRRAQISRRMDQIREISTGTPINALSKLVKRIYRCARAI